MLIYNIITIFFLPIVIIVRLCKAKETVESILQKLTIRMKKRQDGKVIWMHAASVGEALNALHLANVYTKYGYNVLITTFTLTGAQMVRNSSNPSISHAFLPFDATIFTRRFLRHFKPNHMLLIESELWPCMINQARKSITGKKIWISAKMSHNSMNKWERFGQTLLKKILSNFDLIITKTPYLQEFFSKYSSHVTTERSLKLTTLDIADFQVSTNINNLKPAQSNANVITFVSFHEDEHIIAITQITKLLKTSPECFIVYIPRHIYNSNIVNVLKEHDISFVKYSDSAALIKNGVYVVNILGKARDFMSISDICIVGGSFVSGIGGHNILEPLIFEKPVITGRFCENFTEIVEDMMQNNAICVSDADQISEDIMSTINNTEIHSHIINYCKISRGITDRYIKAIGINTLI